MKEQKDLKAKIIIIASALTVVVVLLGAICFVKFGTVNFPRTAIAYISVTSGSKEYVELKGGKERIVIATPKDSRDVLIKYMASRGFVETDRMGGLLVFENGADMEKVFFSLNKYYSLWKWSYN